MLPWAFIFLFFWRRFSYGHEEQPCQIPFSNFFIYEGANVWRRKASYFAGPSSYVIFSFGSPTAPHLTHVQALVLILGPTCWTTCIRLGTDQRVRDISLQFRLAIRICARAGSSKKKAFHSEKEKNAPRFWVLKSWKQKYGHVDIRTTNQTFVRTTYDFSTLEGRHRHIDTMFSNVGPQSRSKS